MRQNLQIIANLRRLDQSIIEYSEMLRRAPDDPAVHSRLGFLYFQKGLHPQAADYWRAAIRLKPNWYEPYINLAGLLATTKDPNLQNPKEALELAEKAAQLNEFNDANLLETYCNILAANKKYTEAINIAEKAIIQAQRAGNKALVEKLNQLIIQFKSKKDDK